MTEVIEARPSREAIRSVYQAMPQWQFVCEYTKIYSSTITIILLNVANGLSCHPDHAPHVRTGGMAIIV